MNNKLITVAAIALTSALSTVSVSAHVDNGGLVSSSGNVVASSYSDCVRVNSGVKSESCGHAKAAKPAAKPAPKKETAQAVSLAGDATFATNSAELSDAGKAAIDAFAEQALLFKISSLDVVGHADSRGDAAYNQDLSERRANTVKSYLESQGIPAYLVKATGEGEDYPVASNDTREGRAANRRVDIIVRGYAL